MKTKQRDPKSIDDKNDLRRSESDQTLLGRCLSRFMYSVVFRLVPRKTKFRLIHRFNLWSSAESVSGPGSELSKTVRLREALPGIISDFEIASVLDVPCGDFNWMKTVDLDGIKYFGGDVVNSLIENNNKEYRSDDVRFGLMDIVNDKLPEADLVIVRDLFIHFSHQNVIASIKNIVQSKSKYILTTTWPDSKVNAEIKDGYNFNINLQDHPFNFPSPLLLIKEMKDSNSERNCVGLWKVADLRVREWASSENV